jgi:serine protease
MRPLAALLACALFTGSLAASERYLVATRNAPQRAQIRMLRDSADFREHGVRTFESADAFAADLTPAEVAELKRSPEVRFVTHVVERHASSLGASSNGSPYRNAQTVPYGVSMIHAIDLWPLTRGAGPINVVILDTGIDMRHPELTANYAGGYNTFTQTADPTDDNGHGTHVAGTIAAADNNFGVVGVAPQARIWSVKVLDEHGFGLDENVVAGVDWVINKKRAVGGDWIMSMSLGASNDSPVEAEAFKRVISEGILAIAAAGNRSFPEVEFPAGYPGVIAVGAVDSTATLASFSDHGPLLSVVAPGVNVLSTARLASIPSAAVTVDKGPSAAAVAITGSSRGEIVGPYVFCGLGRAQDFPISVAGKIALIKRGEITFNQKVRNAQDAGALSVVIYNHDDSDFRFWTLLRPNCADIEGCDDPVHPWPVVLAISSSDGQSLLDNTSNVMDMGFWFDDYLISSGTSMAVPHVSGAAALIWSLRPDATAERVRAALISTSTDLGPPGVDEMYGHGLINAWEAAKRLAPEKFNLSPPSHEPSRQQPPRP